MSAALVAQDPPPTRAAQDALLQKLAGQLYDAFVALDCSMLEINPLIETTADELLVLDAKMSFDSIALYRQPEIEALYGRVTAAAE